MAAKKKTRKSSRRDFLRGRAVRQAAADAVAGVLPEVDDSPQADAGLLVRVSRHAMACEFEVRFPVGRFPDGADQALEALDRVDAFEEAMTYFRASSELCRIATHVDADWRLERVVRECAGPLGGAAAGNGEAVPRPAQAVLARHQAVVCR